jgi:hypothetical protein
MTPKDNAMLLGTAVLAMLLLGIAASYRPAARAVFSEAVEPNLAALLPEGAAVTAQAEVPERPQNGLVVAYARSGTASLGLVAWDKDDGRFTLSSTVAMDSESAPETIGTVTVGSLGTGAPLAAFAHGDGAANGGIVFVYAIAKGTLSPVPMIGADGSTGDAMFPDRSIAGVATTSFDDLDGDGDKDALVTERGEEAGGSGERFTAYVWRDGAFRHDAELTRVVSLSDSLFPEAPNPQDAGEVTP